MFVFQWFVVSFFIRFTFTFIYIFIFRVCWTFVSRFVISKILLRVEHEMCSNMYAKSCRFGIYWIKSSFTLWRISMTKNQQSGQQKRDKRHYKSSTKAWQDSVVGICFDDSFWKFKVHWLLTLLAGHQFRQMTSVSALMCLMLPYGFSLVVNPNALVGFADLGKETDVKCNLSGEQSTFHFYSLLLNAGRTVHLSLFRMHWKPFLK